MKTYKIAKIGRKHEIVSYPEISGFGYTKQYFQGVSYRPPAIGERFILLNKLGGIEINTSPITEMSEGIIKTIYSIYSIEEVSE